MGSEASSLSQLVGGNPGNNPGSRVIYQQSLKGEG